LMVMALAARKITLFETTRAWAIVYVGNFIGAFGTALLVLLSGQYLSGDGAVANAALSLAAAKVALPFDRALFLGVLCNVLVCLAVWLSIGARSTGDKVLAMLFPVAAFVAAGFEHSVANMYLIPLGILIKAWAPAALWTDILVSPDSLSAVTWTGFLWNLVPVTFGNLIGGGLLVGGVYWFVYLRPGRDGR
jgi:formate transporter